MEAKAEMEKLEQGLKLATKITLLEKEVVEFLETAGMNPAVLMVLAGVSSLGSAVKNAMAKEIKSTLGSDKELLQRLREDKDMPKEAMNCVDDLLKEDNKTGEPAADVDFVPIGEK